MIHPRPAIEPAAAVSGLLIVLAANAIYLAGLPAILDPMLSTDAYYIRLAQGPLPLILREDPAWGPLYAVWLKPFCAALGDPLAVYAANLCALSLGVSLALYTYLLLLTRRAAVAVGTALVFLISDLNVPLSNKVGAFAVLLVLAGLAASELVAAGARRTTVVAIGVLLAAYARPELYPAALGLCLAAAWQAGRAARASGPRIILWPAGVMALLLIAAVWVGTPVLGAAHDEDRLLIAFREHFAWNWNRWHDQWSSFGEVWQAAFGSARSFAEALLSNPLAVAHHLADNLGGGLGFLVGSTFDHYPLLVPATWPALVRAENLLLSAAALGGLLLVALRRPWRRQLAERYRHLLLPYVALTACSLGAATLIFPIAHYLVVPAVLLAIAGALAASVIIPGPRSAGWPLRSVAVLACLAAVPRPFVLPSAYVVAGSPFKAGIVATRRITETIELVRGLGLPAPVRVLTLTDGFGDMLGPGFQEVKIWQKDPQQPLADYIRDQHIDVIVSLEAGNSSFFFAADPHWKVIQTTPEAAGFTRLPVPGQETVRVYLRSDLQRD